MIKLVLIYISLLCCSFSTSALVLVKKNTLYYNGQITEVQNNKASELLKSNSSINALTITSGGGNIDFGMDLADLIAAHKLSVSIKDFCFSSCANYILLVGQPTTIEKNAIVGWHGDAASAKWLDSDIDTMVKNLDEPKKSKKWQVLRAHYDQVIAKASKRERAMYKHFNVNHDLLTVGLEPSLRKAAIKKHARGWTYSPKVLASLGVKNIIFNQWQPRSVKHFPLLIIKDVN